MSLKEVQHPRRECEVLECESESGGFIAECVCANSMSV